MGDKTIPKVPLSLALCPRNGEYGVRHGVHLTRKRKAHWSRVDLFTPFFFGSRSSLYSVSGPVIDMGVIVCLCDGDQTDFGDRAKDPCGEELCVMHFQS